MHDSLAKITLFSDLTEEEIAAVERNARWKTYGPGEQVIDQDAESRDIYFVVSGTVRVVNYSQSGREVTFDDLEAGNYFGELSAVDGRPRSAGVVALDNTRIASLSAERFRVVMSEHPDIALRLVEHLVFMVRTSTHRIMDLSTLGAHNRIYADLLRLAAKATKDGISARISPIPIHTEIGARIAATRETVARAMSNLTKRGTVEREKNALIVKDIKSLEQLVEDFHQ